MKKKAILILGMLVLIVVSDLSALNLQIDRDVHLENGRFDEDYLFYGDQLQFRGTAKDLIFIGQNLDFYGQLSLGLLAGGRTVNVLGTVDNGVKAGAKTINIDGQVNGTSFLGAGAVNWGPDSRGSGDVFIGARSVTLKGPIQGNLYVGAGEVSIQNEIQGDVTIRAGQVKIAEQGRIVGNLVYYSDRPLSEAETARVTGEVRLEKSDRGFFHGRHHFRDRDGFIWFSILLKLSLAVFGFLLLLLPATRGLDNRLELGEITSLSLWGLIPVFMYPAMFVVAVLLIITLPLAATLLLAFLPLLLITKTIGLTLIGGWLADVIHLNLKNRFLFYLIAVVPYTVLSLIPIFGVLLLAFVSSIGGGLLLALLLRKKTVRF